MTEPPSTPSVVRLAELAHERLGTMSDVQQARGLNGVMSGFARATGKADHSSPRWWLPRVAALGTLAVVALLVAPALLRDKPLTYSMSRGELQAGGYFRAGTPDPSRLQFSDGTQVDLLPGARGRIASVDRLGARVTLDEGEAAVKVTPRPGARWSFDAGPFVVHVRGTDFQLAWRGAEGRLDVRLHKGAVSVEGPVSEQPIGLRPGQWLTVRLASHEVFVRDFDLAAPPPLSGDPEPLAATSAAVVPPAPALAPPASGLPAVPTGKPHRPSRTAPANPEGPWGPARSEADWQRVLDLANKRGLGRTLAERGSDDLALLADAAHYLRRDDVAQQALLAQRRRFPGSTRARDAAFLLGRIVEQRPDGARDALAWYDRHLAEAPDGAYASEALGRKMTVLARAQGSAAARPIAEEYLRRYPSGTYARAARAFVKYP